MGWIANFCILFGAWNAGNYRHWGWLFTITGCILWATIGYSLHRMDMVFIESIMGFVAARNWWRWRHNGT